MSIRSVTKSQFNRLFNSDMVRENDGYALVFTLVALPVVLGITAFVIDGSRVTNLHTDLQNAVDAIALAGARALDGQSDAIPRAQAAMAAMAGNQVWFGDGGEGEGLGSKVNVTYTVAGGAESNVTVSFLGAIPAFDDTPIGTGACTDSSTNTSSCTVKGATLAIQSNNAKYVRVVATPRVVRTIFSMPGAGVDSLSVGAEAVATYTAAVCDVTPIFICNPFENVVGNALANGLTFNNNFEAGNLYGRQVIVSYGKNGQVGPGNFGFLRTNGNGASALAEALATNSGVCYAKRGLDTKPGANVGPVTTGLNTRFGLYTQGQTFPSSNQAYAPDVNVRKGQSQGGGNGNSGGNGNGNGNGNGGGSEGGSADCNNYDPEQNATNFDAMSFPTGNSEIEIGGGSISGSADWDIETYWDITYGAHDEPPTVQGYTPPALPVTIPKSFPGLSGSTTPSRYDVYNYEIDNNYLNVAAPNGEVGAPQCQADGVTPTRGRREIFSAVVNCDQYSDQLKGAATDIPAESFVKMFLTRPAIASGNDRTIAMEIVDIAGAGGLGTLANFLREEAELVR